MKKTQFNSFKLWTAIFAIVFLLSACASPQAVMVMNSPDMGSTPSTVSPATTSNLTPTVTFTLKTELVDGHLGYTGVGGAIDGVRDPDLKVAMGAVVQVNLVNGDGMEHDFTVPDFNAHTARVVTKGNQVSVTFKADKEGTFPYFCSVPGHRQSGMEGKLIVGEEAAPATASAPSIVRDPSDLPGPIGNRPPQLMRIDLEAVETLGQLADGVTYTYWTFNGKVPGPFLRVRVGDTVELHLKNRAGNSMTHSIDLHAVTGPGGGATVMQVAPGEEKYFTFKALNPGLFVYHCATPMVEEHIANGMFGLILVEPEGGLPKVDHEYYVMQSEIYTQGAYGEKGAQQISMDKLAAETPEYYVFNGAVGGLTTEAPLHAKVGETVRIFFGDAGPNKISSFHIVGESFDRVYDQGSLTSVPLTNVQTTLVPPGGATVVELKVQVPGRYVLVDHALSRMDRGLSGYLIVDGPDAPDIYHSTFPPSANSGH